MKKLSSSGIGPFMEVEGIPYRGLLYSKTNEFFQRRAMTDDEMLRIPVQNVEAGAGKGRQILLLKLKVE